MGRIALLLFAAICISGVTCGLLDDYNVEFPSQQIEIERPAVGLIIGGVLLLLIIPIALICCCCCICCPCYHWCHRNSTNVTVIQPPSGYRYSDVHNHFNADVPAHKSAISQNLPPTYTQGFTKLSSPPDCEANYIQ